MTDRFSAQLRKHLVETADERPADGQLAAVVQTVSVTGQRPRVVARLTWFPGRIGPFPTAALRYGLILLALALGAVAAVVLGFGSPHRSTVFEGTWTATDPADGSTLLLTVGPGITPTVRFEDDFASGEACVNDAVKVFRAEGIGEISGNHLDASYPNGGGCGLALVAIAGAYDYLVGTDSLADQDRVIWVRVGGGGPPATQRPVTSQAAVPSPTRAACLDLHGGGTYQAGVGSLSLTATLPGDTSWEAQRGSFFLSRLGCPRADSVAIEAQVVTHMAADACDRAGPRLKADTAAAAVAALAAQAGVVVTGPTDTTLGGYSASRFEVSVPQGFDATTCTRGAIEPLEGITSMEPGQLHTVYLVDVDGTVLAVVTDWNLADPDLAAQGDAILASLRIEP